MKTITIMVIVVKSGFAPVAAPDGGSGCLSARLAKAVNIL